MSNLHYRNTEVIDRYDVDALVNAVPAKFERTMRVTEAKVEIAPAEPEPDEDTPEGAVYVTVTMWGRYVKGDGSPDKRAGTRQVDCLYDEESRYELAREIIRASLFRHHIAERLVIAPSLFTHTWQAYQNLVQGRQ